MNIKELREICQPKRTEPFLTRTIRRFSIYITWILTFTPITANQVTLSMLFFDLLGAAMIVFGDYTYAVIGVGFTLLSFVIDVVDGEVARYRKTQSIDGAYLDLLIHRISKPLFIMAIAFNVFFRQGDVTILILGFIFAHGVSLKNAIFSTKCEIYHRSRDTSGTDYLPEHLIIKEKPQGNDRRLSGMRKVYKNFFFFYKYPTLLLILSAGVVLNLSGYIIFFYGIVSPFIIAINLYYEYMRGFK